MRNIKKQGLPFFFFPENCHWHHQSGFCPENQHPAQFSLPLDRIWVLELTADNRPQGDISSHALIMIFSKYSAKLGLAPSRRVFPEASGFGQVKHY